MRGSREPATARSGEATGSVELDQRLLLPGNGANQRPFPWRPWREFPARSASDTGEVTIIAPVGAASAEVVIGAKRIPVPLDATGRGTLDLSDSAHAVVRALDRNGNVVGETPLPPREARNTARATGLVGEDANERVVP